MRISDWSSDVCSSDLHSPGNRHRLALLAGCHGAISRQKGKRRRLSSQQEHGHSRPDAGLPDLANWLHVDRRRMVRHVDVGNMERRRSEEHTSELQSLMRISYAVLCLKKNKKTYLIKTLYR